MPLDVTCITDNQSDVSTAWRSAAESGIIVTDGGVVLLPDGPNRKHTKALARLLAKSRNHQRREDFRFYRSYYEFVGRDPAGPLAFQTDSYEDGVARIKLALEKAGLLVELQTNLSNNYKVTRRLGHPNYLGRYTRRIRVLYQQWIEDGLYCSRENPAEVPGWHKTDLSERIRVANATIGNPYGREYAGMRFVVYGRQKHEGRPQNPIGVAEAMTEAVAASEAPEPIKILASIFHDEAPRVNSLLPATGLGWALGEFGDTIFVRRKWGGDDPDLAIGITERVRKWLLTRFAALPHPNDSAKTMLGYMQERLAAGDYSELDSIVLFASEKTGNAYSPSGFRYWFQDVMLTSQVKAGSWTPSPHFYRNCRMHETVTAIFAETAPGAQRSRRLKEAGAEFGHESTCWKTYVHYAWDLESRRVRRENGERRQKEREARAKGEPLPPRQPNLLNPAAARMHSSLPSIPLN